MDKIDNLTLKRMLQRVQRPGRYVGGELNSIVKKDALFHMAVSYPDLYEIGMSNSGIRILYDIANSIEGVACERVFAVDADFEKIMIEENVPLFTLESRTALSKLDLIAFNISHELLYTNILQILSLGEIPLKSKERRDGHPIVIAGGSAASNPAPFGEFVDAFFIGDGEEGIKEIISSLMRQKAKGFSRADMVLELGSIEGCMIPSMYTYEYSGSRLAAVQGKGVRRRIFRSESPSGPGKPVVSNIRLAHERGVVEVARGCPNLCKFCHAGYYDLPFRNYSPDSVREKILNIVAGTGFDEVSLLSLSTGDYKYLSELVNAVLPELTEKGVSLSLPSLKVDSSTLPLIELISDVRMTSLTFAVESGSELIRSMADKKVSSSELLEICERVFSKGWRVIKFYFMIGLPVCDRANEASEIAALVKQVLTLSRKNIEINVTLSPFIPKPHTPFELEEQMSEDYFVNTVQAVKKSLPRSVKVKSHDVKASTLEGVFSRGDSRVGSVVLKSFLDGCRLDSWNEHFKPDIWFSNLDEILPGWRSYHAKKSVDDVLPWNMVSTGYDELIAKRRDYCADLSGYRSPERDLMSGIDRKAASDSLEKFKLKYRTVKRVRIRFSKTGNARYVPHLDFVEVVKRALRMAGAPLSFTQGFNKHERLSFGFPVPLGIESEDELCDAELHDEWGISPGYLSSKLPEGISATKIEYIDINESIMAMTGAVEYRIEFDDLSFHRILSDALVAARDFVKTGKRGERAVPFGEAVLSYKIEPEHILITLSAGKDYSIRIDSAVCSLAGVPSDDLYRFIITKTAQYHIGPDGLKLI